MSASPIHITMVTLGVADVQAAAGFYEKLGLQRSPASQDAVVFFDMGGVALGLYGREPLAEDAGVLPRGEGFRAVTLAWNQPNEEAVDDAMIRAIEAGGQMIKAAKKVFWGGDSGYFSDPDGHLWEVAYNPHSPVREDGTMEL